MPHLTHCSIDLDYIIHRGGAKVLEAGVTHMGIKHPESWWIAYATILKASGREAMPTCSNFDAAGNCKGCES